MASRVKYYMIEDESYKYEILFEVKFHLAIMSDKDKKQYIGTYIIGYNSKDEPITFTYIKGIKYGNLEYDKTKSFNALSTDLKNKIILNHIKDKRMITKEQTREKVENLIVDIQKHMTERLEQIINSGAINFEEYNNDYILPKMIIQALLQKEQNLYQFPKGFYNERKLKKEVKNIYNHLWL